MLTKPHLTLEWPIRLIIGAIFCFASWHKIAAPGDFARVITNYQILPELAVHAMALWLPWIELVSGVCLISGWYKTGASVVIAVLLAVFIGALGASLYRGIDMNCGCFSSGRYNTGNLLIDLFRDMVLLAMSVALIIRLFKKGTREEGLH